VAVGAGDGALDKHNCQPAFFDHCSQTLVVSVPPPLARSNNKVPFYPRCRWPYPTALICGTLSGRARPLPVRIGSPMSASNYFLMDYKLVMVRTRE